MNIHVKAPAGKTLRVKDVLKHGGIFDSVQQLKLTAENEYERKFLCWLWQQYMSGFLEAWFDHRIVADDITAQTGNSLPTPGTADA